MPRRTITAMALVVVALLALPPLISQAARSRAQIDRELEDRRRQLDNRKRRAVVLTSDIRSLSARATALGDDISRLSARRSALTTQLDASRARLDGLQDRLRDERARLTRARVRLGQSRELLSRRLVELYKADRPDLVSIVLESQDFSQLFERAELLRRVSEADVNTIERVRIARDEAQAASTQLADLSAEAQEQATAIRERHDAVATVHDQLSARRASLRSARDERRRTLDTVRAQHDHLHDEVEALERESVKVRNALLGASAPSAGGDGTLSWPVDGPLTSGFGSRWGRLHAGIDIAPPAGTPIHAAGAGTVVIAGWQGGYGNMVCVQHTAALTTCYAHQPGISVSVGAKVAAGEVIGAVGNTGNSTGPHLHFETRVNGSPVDPLGYL